MTVDLHLLEGVCSAMRLDVDSTYKLAMIMVVHHKSYNGRD